MPEEKPKPNTQPATPNTAAPAPTVPAPVEPTEPQDRILDETIPGGRYKTDTGYVNAEGQPIDKDGNLIKDDS